MMSFQKSLLSWYFKNARDLPWRRTKDPYAIWVSEIMLQQTQVLRVVDFYTRFLKRFSRVEDLAAASWEEVLEYWRGLGYYRRARNLHAAARVIVEKMDGKFPQSFYELQKLAGVGEYTAAAIASFAFEVDVPALDTNLKRVLGRLLGKFLDFTPKQQFEYAKFLIPQGKGPIFNHALMDIGATVCFAQKPVCEVCPLSKSCEFFARIKERNVIPIMDSCLRRNDKRAGNDEGHFNDRKKLNASRKMLVLADARLEKLKGQNSKGKGAVQKVAAGVVIRDGKVLISKRRKDVAFGNFWEFPGGKLEVCENERTCLKRELQEELGIEVSVRPPFYRVRTEHAGVTILLSFHRCSLLLGEPKALQVEEFLWIEPEHLLEYEFPPVNREVIEILLKKKAMFRG